MSAFTSSEPPPWDAGVPLDLKPGISAPDRASTPPPPPAASGRRRPDRRQNATPRFSRFALLGGRRRGSRRRGEAGGGFVDLYSKRLWALLLWVAAMNLADSYFTLVHLQAGGLELNPVADALLRTGRLGFVLSKSLLIGVALVVLCVHKNYLMARVGLLLSAGIYSLLVLYHLSLFDR